MTCYALVSPQGHVEYNAEFALGEAGVKKLEHGKWYTNDELDRVSSGFELYPPGRFIQAAIFHSDSPQCVEKNIKKWRFEVRP